MFQLFLESSHKKNPVAKPYFTKVVGFYRCNYQAEGCKKETLAQVFSCNIAKFLRTPFLQDTSGLLLLTFQNQSLEVS